MKDDHKLTKCKMAARLSKTVRTIQRALDKLVGEKKIRRVGSNKAGHWQTW